MRPVAILRALARGWAFVWVDDGCSDPGWYAWRGGSYREPDHETAIMPTIGDAAKQALRMD